MAHWSKIWREENCFAGGGGGMARKPICPTPLSPSLVAVPGGGFGLGLPYLPCRGGGGEPRHTWLKMIPTWRMAWAPGEGGGGFQKWASVPGPLFCVRTDVATKGTGTQFLARKIFFTKNFSPTYV